jgi:hypothetical protein
VARKLVAKRTERIIVYHIQPQTLVGRVLASLILLLVLGFVFLFSLVLFAILSTGLLVAIGYALWRTHEMTRRRGRIIDVDRHDG